MKNKPINKVYHIDIELQYSEGTCNLDYLSMSETEESLNIIDSFVRHGWYLDHNSEGWKVIKRVRLYEGEEKVIRHPDGEEYIYKVYKK